MKNLYSKIFLVLLTFIVWLLLTYAFDIQHILVGLLCSFTVVLLISDVCLQGQWKFSKPTKYFWFLYYLPVFAWEVIKANIDVAYRILNPQMPIKPGIVKIKTKLRSDIGLTMLANSITLTPGTMSVDIDKDNGYIYVHWIYVRTKDIGEATQKISSRLENILIKIFD